MANMMELFLFGVLLQMFQLCCVNADGDYAGYYGGYRVPLTTIIAIVAIVMGMIFLVVIAFCYWRFKLRTPHITRTITVQRTVPGIIQDSNPNHAGYNQGMIQPKSPTHYMEEMP